MDSLVAVDMIDDLLHNAPSVPFRWSEARVDRDELIAGVTRLRVAVGRELREPERARAWPVVERLEAMVLGAERVRLLGGVRVDRDAMYELLDEIRAKLPEDLHEQRVP